MLLFQARETLVNHLHLLIVQLMDYMHNMQKVFIAVIQFSFQFSIISLKTIPI